MSGILYRETNGIGSVCCSVLVLLRGREEKFRSQALSA